MWWAGVVNVYTCQKNNRFVVWLNSFVNIMNDIPWKELEAEKGWS